MNIPTRPFVPPNLNFSVRTALYQGHASGNSGDPYPHRWHADRHRRRLLLRWGKISGVQRRRPDAKVSCRQDSSSPCHVAKDTVLGDLLRLNMV